jgi:carbamoyl-phosphate synthase small subunit
LGPNLKVTHKSLFDGSLQGIERTDRPAFSFQGHPEASPGPHEVRSLFGRFMTLINERLTSQIVAKELARRAAER